jgi:dTDP-4-dehydrorhamnose reductase
VKILLLGCNGQVGWELQRSLAPLGDVIACDFESITDRRVDFTKPAAVAELIDRIQPRVIVNSAAYTAVDMAESEAELARMINATTPGVIAERARALGALFVHYSTDYVFDGSGNHPRDELAATGPLSVYGKTKLEGDERICGSGCRHLILRTSWAHAVRGRNFIKTMLRLAAERDELSVISDQIGAPTGADLLADVTAQAISQVIAERGETGVFNCVAAGHTSWFDYARFVIEWARTQGLPVKVKPEAIRAVATEAYPTPAQRPRNSRLSTEKLQRVFSLTLPPWQHGVERMLRETYGK